MAEVIPINTARLICKAPLRFQLMTGPARSPILVPAEAAPEFELRGQRGGGLGRCRILKGGPAQTCLGLFQRRADESAMRDLYYLAGLVTLNTSLSHPVLLTDLVHRVFEEIEHLSSRIGFRWSVRDQDYFLPLPINIYDGIGLVNRLQQASDLAGLRRILRRESDHQFDLLYRHYIIFIPANWLPGPA